MLLRTDLTLGLRVACCWTYKAAGRHHNLIFSHVTDELVNALLTNHCDYFADLLIDRYFVCVCVCVDVCEWVSV